MTNTENTRTHDNYNEGRCYGCNAEVEDAPGVYYCPACVGDQLAEAAKELQAFNDYHTFADAIARRTR